MPQTAYARVRGSFALVCSLAAAALSAGCLSYSPARLSAMSSVDLCELGEVQGFNLSLDTKRALEGELQRRNERCSSHAAVLAERRQAFMEREMYGRHDNP